MYECVIVYVNVYIICEVIYIKYAVGYVKPPKAAEELYKAIHEVLEVDRDQVLDRMKRKEAREQQRVQELQRLQQCYGVKSPVVCNTDTASTPLKSDSPSKRMLHRLLTLGMPSNPPLELEERDRVCSTNTSSNPGSGISGLVRRLSTGGGGTGRGGGVMMSSTSSSSNVTGLQPYPPVPLIIPTGYREYIPSSSLDLWVILSQRRKQQCKRELHLTKVFKQGVGIMRYRREDSSDSSSSGGSEYANENATVVGESELREDAVQSQHQGQLREDAVQSQHQGQLREGAVINTQHPSPAYENSMDHSMEEEEEEEENSESEASTTTSSSEEEEEEDDGWVSEARVHKGRGAVDELEECIEEDCNLGRRWLLGVGTGGEELIEDYVPEGLLIKPNRNVNNANTNTVTTTDNATATIIHSNQEGVNNTRGAKKKKFTHHSSLELHPMNHPLEGEYIRVYRGWRYSLALCTSGCTRSPSIVNSISFQQAKSVREQLEAEGYVFEGEEEGGVGFSGDAEVNPEKEDERDPPPESRADSVQSTVEESEPLQPVVLMYNHGDGVLSSNTATNGSSDYIIDDYLLLIHTVEL